MRIINKCVANLPFLHGTWTHSPQIRAEIFISESNNSFLDNAWDLLVFLLTEYISLPTRRTSFNSYLTSERVK